MTNNTTILYVDDELVNITLFNANFRDKFNIVSATSGEEALVELAKNKDITIVISDLRMPKMSGMEFVYEAHKRYPQLHCFILSGFEVTEEIQSYIDQKILTGYFGKPIRFSQITEKINLLTEKVG